MGAKPKVKKIGGSFDTFSFSLRGDNARVSPTYFEWSDDTYDGKPKLFFFGDALREAAYHDPYWCVAILTEPRGLHPENYEFVEQNHDKFHTVLTFDKALIDAVPNAKFYPLGGSSIAFDLWGHYEKTKDVCMIVSKKNTTPGHKMRHTIVKEFPNRIDFYGSGVGKPFDRKFDILKEYKYCVVVESEYRPNYFSEELIDAISVGCIPLFWTPGKEGRRIVTEFNLITFNNTLVLEYIINWPPLQLHPLDPELVKKYAIAEDWIWNVYPELFT